MSALPTSAQCRFASIDRSPKAGLRILLADDNALVRKATQRQIHAIFANCQVDECGDGGQALGKIKESHDIYKCVILDYRMPIMDGIEATQAIRALESERRLERLPIMRTRPYSSSSVNWRH